MIGDIDDPARVPEIKATIAAKPSLRHYYEGVYARYAACLSRCPPSGQAIELGAGAGFGKDMIPELLTSDILPYAGLDLALDARDMPFADSSLRFIGMHNVFHHIPDVEAFLREAGRCLVPGGRLLIVDQHVGLISRPILAHFHNEPFNIRAKQWQFETSGPLSGANGALAWIVFSRDRERFERMFPCFRIRHYRPHTPLFYWLTGGLKSWNLIPSIMIPFVEVLDRMFSRLSAHFGSFVDIDIEKISPSDKVIPTDSGET